jgi:hypothetical protein
MNALCSIDGCDKARVARGFCAMHISRVYRHGDPHAGPSRAGQGYRRPEGYVMIGRKGHPLAQGARQNAWLHRVVLYDAIGPGPHGCHWCGVLVAWKPADFCERLVVDHLDGDPRNNDRSNLVPACQPCNISRHRDGNARPRGVLR